MRIAWLALLLLVQADAPRGRQATSLVFRFEGVGLDSDLNDIARRYPGATREGDFLRLSSANRGGAARGFAVSGSGSTRRVRIFFEETGSGGQPSYPTCLSIQRQITRTYGPPTTIREFSEEASRRADRVWQSEAEEMILVCFRPPKGTRELKAEAVVIARRKPK